jgi:peptidoglycan/LPS O-acetylase OafA/YrhL
MSFFTETNRTKSGKVESHLRWWVTLILSMALSIGTWNPTEHNFINYIQEGDMFSGFHPFFILVMIALWLMAFKAVLQSIKIYGAIISVAIIAAFVYGLAQMGWLDTSKWSTLGWVASIGAGLIIFVGMNASILWKKMTGVYTTDATDED